MTGEMGRTTRRPTGSSRSPARGRPLGVRARNGDRLGEVPVGSHPVHATTCRGRTVVATMGERAVTAVDASGEVTQVETGVLGPSHFAGANGELYVSCSAGDALAVVDPESLTLVDRVAVGAEPHEVRSPRTATGSTPEPPRRRRRRRRHRTRAGRRDRRRPGRQGAGRRARAGREPRVRGRPARRPRRRLRSRGRFRTSGRRSVDLRRGRGRRRPVRPRRDR